MGQELLLMGRCAVVGGLWQGSGCGVQGAAAAVVGGLWQGSGCGVQGAAVIVAGSRVQSARHGVQGVAVSVVDGLKPEGPRTTRR